MLKVVMSIAGDCEDLKLLWVFEGILNIQRDYGYPKGVGISKRL